MRVSITTHGCRLNQFESDAMGRVARESGCELVGAAEAADVYVVNTCTITHQADADARQVIRRIARRRPGARIVVTGCYATSAPDDVARIPGVELVFGNREKERWGEFLAGARAAPDAAPPDQARSFVAAVDLARRVRVTRLRPDTQPDRSRAYLKIQDGCDYRCAFCIVPHVRGRSASVPVEVVLGQLDELVAAGVPEVVLTGVHLGIYGRDLQPRVRLSDLVARMLERLSRTESAGGGPPTRVRLGSLDPHEVDEPLIALFEAHPRRLCRHLHLPVQTGDDGVLRSMRRGHTVADLERLVPELVARIPGVAIGTDVIAGFPGEDDDAFARTHALLDRLPVTYMHVFPFSKRDGTPAATMDRQVPGPTKSDRCRRLRTLSDAKARAFRTAHEGRTLDAVLYRGRDHGRGTLVGLTDNYIKVRVDGDELPPRGVARVRVDEAGEDAARATIVV